MGDNKDLGERLKQGADDIVLWLTFAIAWFCFIAVFNWLGLFLGWFPAILVAIVVSELWAQPLTVVLVILFWLVVVVAFFLHQCS